MYYSDKELKDAMGKLVIGYVRKTDPDYDTKENRRVFIKDIRQYDYDDRNGWHNVFSLADKPVDHSGFGLYRITNLRKDKNNYPIFILRHMADLPDNLEIDFVGHWMNDTTLALHLLMDSPSMLKKDSNESWMQSCLDDFNFQMLCDTINGLSNHPKETVTLENLTTVFPSVIASAGLSFPQVRDILLTPTAAQIEAKKQREAEAEAKAEAAKQAAAVARQEEKRIAGLKLDFMRNPIAYHEKFPFFVTKWISHIRSLRYIRIQEFDRFLKKYESKFFDEVNLGHLQADAIPDTITDANLDDPLAMRYAEMYLAFDEPRKAAHKAAKTAAKRAKKGKKI